jgi:hypothetical protein
MNVPLKIFLNEHVLDITPTIFFEFDKETASELRTKIEEAILFLKSNNKIDKRAKLEKVENMYVYGEEDNILLLNGPIRIDKIAEDITLDVYLSTPVGGRRRSRTRKSRKNRKSRRR